MRLHRFKMQWYISLSHFLDAFAYFRISSVKIKRKVWTRKDFPESGLFVVHFVISFYGHNFQSCSLRWQKLYGKSFQCTCPIIMELCWLLNNLKLKVVFEYFYHTTWLCCCYECYERFFLWPELLILRWQELLIQLYTKWVGTWSMLSFAIFFQNKRKYFVKFWLLSIFAKQILCGETQYVFSLWI